MFENRDDKKRDTDRWSSLKNVSPMKQLSPPEWETRDNYILESQEKLCFIQGAASGVRSHSRQNRMYNESMGRAVTSSGPVRCHSDQINDLFRTRHCDTARWHCASPSGEQTRYNGIDLNTCMKQDSVLFSLDDIQIGCTT